MADESPTLGDLFELSSDHGRRRLPDGWERFREKLDEEVKGITWAASMPDLVSKVAELLEVRISGVLIAAWKKASEVATLLAESEAAPDDTFHLELATHTISSTHHPYITVRVARLPPKKVEFTVTMAFTLNGCELKIQRGAIQEIHTGTCEAEGTLEGLGLVLARRKLEPLTLPGTIRIVEMAEAG